MAHTSEWGPHTTAQASQEETRRRQRIEDDGDEKNDGNSEAMDPANFTYLGCDQRRLVALPTTDRSAQRENWRPVDVQTFIKCQRRQMEACKTVVLDQWMEDDVLSVFRETAQQGVFASVPQRVLRRFFDSLAVLMSNCTRSVVLASLRELLSFFNRYRPGVVASLDVGMTRGLGRPISSCVVR